MKKVLFAIIAILSLNSINAQDQYRLSETGLKFKLINDEKGNTATIGDLVSLDMLITSPSGEEIKNSYKSGKPILFPVKISQFEGDIYEAVTLLSEGDSAEFLINADSMFAHTFRKSLPDNMRSGEFLTTVISVHKIRSQQEYQDEQKSYYEQNIKQKEEQALSSRLANENQQIEAKLAQEGIENFNKTESGVYYYIIEYGKGDLLEDGDAVVFHYVGHFLDGTQFESTYNLGQPASFQLGKGNVIKGWEDVFPKLNVGTTAKVFVPSHLAYGSLEKEGIPKHSVLVFDLQVLAKY